jgi:hypothetical protein
MTDLPDETQYRFVAVLNKKVEIGRLLNALGHMTAGLAGGHPDSSNFSLLQYTDADGGVHPNISHFPYIVLKADNSNQLRTLRNELISRGLPYTDFTSTMIVGTSAEQQNATKAAHEVDLEYFGVCTFADTETLRTLTKRFRLF